MFKSNNPAVQFVEVTKKFPNTIAVDNLSLTINQGEFYVLLGKNGAGKTTALRMLTGLETPDHGQILVHGQNIAQHGKYARTQIAYLPDEPLLYDLLRPLEYLEFVAGLWNMDRKAASEKANQLLLDFDLWDHQAKFIKTFSRGMRQKLALAGGLIHDPSIIVLDEPLTGLDAIAAKKVKDVLRAKASAGASIILTTHMLEVVERLADTVAIINEGKIVAAAPMDEILQQSNSNTLEDAFIKLVACQ